MKRFEAKTIVLLTLPALAFLFFVFISSKEHSSSANFRVVKHEIAWETESPAGITGLTNSIRFEKVFVHRVIVNYPTPFLARYRPGASQAFLNLQGPKPHALSIRTTCIDAKGVFLPRRQHIEWNHIGEATSETEYNLKDLRSASWPLLFHVYFQWNDGSKPIHSSAKIMSFAILKTTERFSLDPKIIKFEP